MILNQTDFFARSATLDGAISDTDTQITLAGLSTRFTEAVAAGTVRYPLGPFRISDDDGFELIAITDHVSGTTFEVERGIQGTDAAAWADGAAVRAVVTREQLVDRSLTHSQIIKPSSRLIAHDDFSRGDLGAGWNVLQGSASIDDGRLKLEANTFVEWVDAGAAQDGVLYKMAGHVFGNNSDGGPGLVPAWQDSDNFWLVRLERDGLKITETAVGSTTILDTGRLTGLLWRDGTPYEMHVLVGAAFGLLDRVMGQIVPVTGNAAVVTDSDPGFTDPVVGVGNDTGDTQYIEHIIAIKS